MTIYWLMFLLPAAYAMVPHSNSNIVLQGMRSTSVNRTWFAIFLLVTILVGYRFEVGGDWFNYLRHLRQARFHDISAAIETGDPAYRLLNLIAVRLGWGIFGVNLVSAALFSLGLVLLCRGLPRPWLALAVAMPYMVTVVAMGYTRQSVALGLAMLGLVALTRRANLWFVFWVMCAATFHKSAILLLPIAALADTFNRYWTILWVSAVTLLAYYLFLEDSVDALFANYIEREYQSQGALIRAAMNLVPAGIYLIFGKRFHLQVAEEKLWRWFSIISIVLFLIVMASPATTAVDRVALYMLPLQLVVFSYLPDVLGRPDDQNRGIVSMVLLYYGAVLFVWLNYASHAFAWLPYRFYPLEAWL